MGNSSDLRKLSYAIPSSPKRCKGSRYYLLSVITLGPSTKTIEMEKLRCVVTRFVDDEPLNILLVKLCDLKKLAQ